MTTKEREELIDFSIGKLTELKIKYEIKKARRKPF